MFRKGNKVIERGRRETKENQRQREDYMISQARHKRGANKRPCVRLRSEESTEPAGALVSTTVIPLLFYR